jgi:uncharacterized membrane protein
LPVRTEAGQDAPVSTAELHPFVLHFAVALLVAGPACDAFGLLLRREALLQAGRWNTLIGAGASLATVLTGLAAEAALGPHSRAGAALLSLHKGLGLLSLGIWLPLAGWRALSRLALPLRLRTLYLTLSFVGAALALSQAGLGSAMVYRHGVGLSPGARAQPAPREAPPAAAPNSH